MDKEDLQFAKENKIEISCAMCGNEKLEELKMNSMCCSSYGVFIYCKNNIDCYEQYVNYMSQKDLTGGLPRSSYKHFQLQEIEAKNNDRCNYCEASDNLTIAPTRNLESNRKNIEFRLFCKNHKCYKEFCLFLSRCPIRIPAFLYKNELHKVIVSTL